jgi:hypothetical protein
MQHVMTRLWDLPMAVDENGTPWPRIIPLSAEAADTFQEWREEHHDDTVGGRIGGHYGKMPGLLLRLSLILEYLCWASNPELTPEPETVSLKAVGYAAHLIEDYFKPMAERCFGEGSRIAIIGGSTAIVGRAGQTLCGNEKCPSLEKEKTAPDVVLRTLHH